jgi:galactokinase
VSAEDARAYFARHFGGAPAVLYSAPARVNLIGEHTDYNGGEVLPIGIGRRTWVAARPRPGDRTHVVSATEEGRGIFDPRTPDRAGAWWDYVAGTAWALGGLAGVAAPAADIAIWSEVPPGAGLGSSAALEVACAVTLQALAGGALRARELALACWRAEVEFVGVACGIMDQFASALARRGHALHVWCKQAAYEYAPMSDAVLIFDTASPRALRDSAFNTRHAECEAALAMLRRSDPGLETLADADPEQVEAAALPSPLDRRARHVATETRRTRAAVAALLAGGPVPGALLLASHASLRDDFQCSSAELDWFVERAMAAPGVRGAKLSGAGWGGCAIAVGDDEPALVEAGSQLAARYRQRFGRTPRVWVSRAESGAAADTG